MLPTASVAVGHGRMNEKELEDIMLSFVNGENDVLVSTTIIFHAAAHASADHGEMGTARKRDLVGVDQERGRSRAQIKIGRAHV